MEKKQLVEEMKEHMEVKLKEFLDSRTDLTLEAENYVTMGFVNGYKEGMNNMFNIISNVLLTTDS